VTVDDTTDLDGDGIPDVLSRLAALGFELEGIMDLEVNATVPGGGQLRLRSLAITAVVDLQVSFGADSKNGFFILPIRAPIPR
jgi:hypothetical protein